MMTEAQKLVAANMALLAVIKQRSPHVAAFWEAALRRGESVDIPAIAEQLGLEPAKLIGLLAEEMYRRTNEVVIPLPRQGGAPASKSDAPASKPTLSAVK